MDALRLLLVAFACFRLAELIVVDDGLFDVCLKFRTWVGVYDLDNAGRPATELGRLFQCPYCIGLWISLILGLLFPWLPDWFLLVFGIAGMQALFQTLGGRT